LTPRNRWRLIGLVVTVLGAYLYAMPEFAWHRLMMLVVLGSGAWGLHLGRGLFAATLPLFSASAFSLSYM
jgi:hypothetical protein